MLEMFKGVANSPETTITNNISNSDALIYVLDETRIPEPPNLMVLGTGVGAETIKVLSIDGNAITVERGFQGVAKAWNAGTIIARNFTEYDYNALVENVRTLKESTDTNADDILNLIQYVGDLESLDTVEKSNIVLALNEIYQDLASHKAETIHQGKNATLEATSTDNATSATNAPLKSAGGLAVAKDARINGLITAGTWFTKSSQAISIDGGVTATIKFTGFSHFFGTLKLFGTANYTVLLMELLFGGWYSTAGALNRHDFFEPKIKKHQNIEIGEIIKSANTLTFTLKSLGGPIVLYWGLEGYSDYPVSGNNITVEF